MVVWFMVTQTAQRAQGMQMSTGETLPISRTRKREVMDAVTDYLGSRR